MKLRCVVERITYQNPENGYTILKCRVKDYADLVPERLRPLMVLSLLKERLFDPYLQKAL